MSHQQPDSQPLSLATSIETIHPYKRCIIHPVVVFTILNYYIRRQEGDSRVIGALLGTIKKVTGVVQIHNCYPVPHSDSDEFEVKINPEFHKTMLNLHRKMNPIDTIVGWYSTGDFHPSAMKIHNFFKNEMNRPPIHMLVGADLSQGKMSVQTFYNFVVSSLSGKLILQEQFLPLPNDYITSKSELSIMSSMVENVANSTISKSSQPLGLSELSGIESTLKQLHQVLQVIVNHLDEIIQGNLPPDPELGRYLQYTLSKISISDSSFETMLTNSMQDPLLVIYLARLTQSHLLLAEKIRDQTNGATNSLNDQRS